MTLLWFGSVARFICPPGTFREPPGNPNHWVIQANGAQCVSSLQRCGDRGVSEVSENVFQPRLGWEVLRLEVVHTNRPKRPFKGSSSHKMIGCLQLHASASGLKTVGLCGISQVPFAPTEAPGVLGPSTCSCQHATSPSGLWATAPKAPSLVSLVQLELGDSAQKGT